jgi:alpha-methylacyl-CoA racemase
VTSAPALAGITVLDFSTVGPAARASRMLSDYGASVVKIGAVARAGSVQLIPPFYAYSAGRDTRQIRLDLKAHEGRDAFLRLAARSDVVLESFRPGVVDRLGIGYDDVRAVNDSIVYCSTSGYGQSGPYSTRAGHDLNYLALGGYLDCSERAPGDKPPLPGATVADAAGGGMQAAMAVMAALVRRATTGEGAHLDVSISDGVVSLMALYVDEYLATGTVPGPGHYILTGRYACYDTYRCADDRWVAVGAIEPQFWANLCKLLDCERWIEHQMDDAAQADVRADLRAAFARKPRDEWVALLADADTCVSAVYTVPELVDDPHVRARGLIGEASRQVADGSTETFRQLGTLLAGTNTARSSFAAVDAQASDADALLLEAGLSADEIARLKEGGVVA